MCVHLNGLRSVCANALARRCSWIPIFDWILCGRCVLIIFNLDTDPSDYSVNQWNISFKWLAIKCCVRSCWLDDSVAIFKLLKAVLFFSVHFQSCLLCFSNRWTEKKKNETELNFIIGNRRRDKKKRARALMPTHQWSSRNNLFVNGTTWNINSINSNEKKRKTKNA